MDSKNNLVQAFMKLYKNNSIERISVKEITLLAGYNRTTFYTHFDNVWDILNFVEENFICYIEKNILQKLTVDDNSDDVIKYLSAIYEGHGENLSILFQSQSFVERYKKILKPAFMKYFKIDAQNIQSEITCEFAISAIIGSFNYWYKNREKTPAKKFISQVRKNLKRLLQR